MEQTDELFYLQENESYDKLCGEIFLTTFGRMALHCTLCNGKYGGLDRYISHLNDEHLTTLEYLENNVDLESVDMSSSQESINDTDQEDDSTPYVSIEIEALHDEEEMTEEESTMTASQNDDQINDNSLCITNEMKRSRKKEPATIQIAKRKKQISKHEQLEDLSDELQIPNEIREVKKRTLRGPLVTPDEERKHKCPICGLAFKERHNMRHHFRRHSNERNHKCPQCDKKFYTPTEVRIHMQFHTRERPFLCSDCGMAFLTKSHLVSHAKIHANQRDFKCSLCEKAFYNSGQLKNHMQGHSKDRPFSCDLCPAAFSRKEALKNHMKLHENKREYKCKLCDAEFNQKAGLFSHVKTHKQR